MSEEVITVSLLTSFQSYWQEGNAALRLLNATKMVVFIKRTLGTLKWYNVKHGYSFIY